ncbi:polynucleotide adenylyltransferase PcnB [Nitrosomonas sp.]|uniref:polynucleotide adenylyltransferase PcnB n=1 Tax=Nitrosomonas sp. TaxID=42353 RepID=UPI0025D83DDF|nr:polynucleotide adenylyltransferase PcnB [Nitrosomonas sp.]MBS0587266.1 polynucleotide adenylyltransferase PcnB [Pseudomonadota bacterium]MBV6447389.1 Poly(A) polymerase I [Nitrosomonas sp.]
MIRKFLRKVFSRKTPASESIATLSIIPNKQHSIRRNQINPCALKIATNLQQAGFSAYIVGGAVRDLLLGLTPKDFDVATNATPEEVRQLFRRSRIIGRRFRLVHVMCGAETVEVSTFRGPSPDDEEDSATIPQTDAHGRLLHDNVFGSQEEDAVRRDFTVNALFYDPVKEEILDYLNGFDDIKAKKLRIIGDPVQRYREDPVRLLRAVRLASKLGMQIDAETAQPIGDLAPLLQNVPPSRLFDEMLKLLLSGHSLSCVVELRARGLHHGLLPMLDVILEQPLGERFITIALKNTDERIKQNKPVSPGFLFAILLWHEVLSNWNTLKTSGEKPMPALFKAADQVLSLQHEKLAIPRRFDAVIQEIWAMQPRFEARSGRKPFHLLSHPRFRAAFDFMLLRCESGELSPELGEWWRAFLSADSEEREKLLSKQIAGKKPRRRRSRKKPSSAPLAQPDNPTNPENI